MELIRQLLPTSSISQIRSSVLNDTSSDKKYHQMMRTATRINAEPELPSLPSAHDLSHTATN
jgi:hypothetical protein